MDTERQLTATESEILMSLAQMFPQLDIKVVRQSIVDPGNRREPYDDNMLLQRCIDDLLETVADINAAEAHQSLVSASRRLSSADNNNSTSSSSTAPLFSRDADAGSPGTSAFPRLKPASFEDSFANSSPHSLDAEATSIMVEDLLWNDMYDDLSDELLQGIPESRHSPKTPGSQLMDDATSRRETVGSIVRKRKRPATPTTLTKDDLGNVVAAAESTVPRKRQNSSESTKPQNTTLAPSPFGFGSQKGKASSSSSIGGAKLSGSSSFSRAKVTASSSFSSAKVAGPSSLNSARVTAPSSSSRPKVTASSLSTARVAAPSSSSSAKVAAPSSLSSAKVAAPSLSSAKVTASSSLGSAKVAAPSSLSSTKVTAFSSLSSATATASSSLSSANVAAPSSLSSAKATAPSSFSSTTVASSQAPKRKPRPAPLVLPPHLRLPGDRPPSPPPRPASSTTVTTAPAAHTGHTTPQYNTNTVMPTAMRPAAQYPAGPLGFPPPRLHDTNHLPPPPPGGVRPEVPQSAVGLDLSSDVNGIQPLPQPGPVPKPNQDDENFATVCEMFPDIDPEYVRQKLAESPHRSPVIVLCNELLEDPNYPKKQKPTTPPKNTPAPKEPKRDYYKDYENHVFNDEHREQGLILLQQEFRKVSVRDLCKLYRAFNNHYAPTHKCLLDTLKENKVWFEEDVEVPELASPSHYPAVTWRLGSHPDPVHARTVTKMPNNAASEGTVTLWLLKSKRTKRKLHNLEPELQREVEFVLADFRSSKEASDHHLAVTLNENDYEAEGQNIECGCCYGEYPFESMVQCYEGHLFCRDCLKNYAKEAVYGQGKSKLQCMTDDCESVYPREQLQVALTSEMLSKYDERLQEEALAITEMEDLVRCPECGFAAIMDPGDKVFTCQNQDCLKETCRYCKENWTDHFGIPCSELEKKDETKLRTAFEEKMTEAKMRKCFKCKALFYKSDGCNRMTCRCGAKMCYICRAPHIEYKHFCQHLREPGQPCKVCKACSLWTNPEEDDERAVEEIRKSASEARKAQGFTDDKLIGAPEEKSSSNTKKNVPPPQVANAVVY